MATFRIAGLSAYRQVVEQQQLVSAECHCGGLFLDREHGRMRCSRCWLFSHLFNASTWPLTSGWSRNARHAFQTRLAMHRSTIASPGFVDVIQLKESLLADVNAVYAAVRQDDSE